MSSIRLGLFSALVGACALVFPTFANAAKIDYSPSPDRLIFAGGGAIDGDPEESDLAVTLNGGRYYFEESGDASEEFAIAQPARSFCALEPDLSDSIRTVISCEAANPAQPVRELSFDPEAGDDTIDLSELPQLSGVSVTVNGGQHDDTITGTEGIDTLNGNGGADDISGQGGNDALAGGPGEDGRDDWDTTSEGDDDFVDGGEGQDTIDGDKGGDTLFGGPERDLIHGGQHDDTIVGEGGSDEMYGEGGEDFVESADGESDPVVDCGDNDDYAQVDRKNRDTVDDSCETVVFPPVPPSSGSVWIENGVMRYEAAANKINRINLWQEGDRVKIEDTVPKSFADGSPDDTLHLIVLPEEEGNGCVEEGLHVVSCAASLFTSVRVNAADNFDYIRSTAAVTTQLLGDLGNDTIIGGPGKDTIDAGAGEDRVDGGLGTDKMSGGDGSDTVFYVSHETAVKVDLNGKANDGSGSEKDLVGGDFEHIYGGAGNDVLKGDGRQNFIWGEGGSDKISNGDGDDQTVLSDVVATADKKPSCGGGTADRLYIDQQDGAKLKFPKNCEEVYGFPRVAIDPTTLRFEVAPPAAAMRSAPAALRGMEPSEVMTGRQGKAPRNCVQITLRGGRSACVRDTNHDGRIKIGCTGDSNSQHGLGGPVTRWCQLLGQSSNVDILQIGRAGGGATFHFAGERSAMNGSNQIDDALAQGADIVVMAFVTNDLRENATSRQVLRALRRLTKKVERSKAGGFRGRRALVLGGPPFDAPEGQVIPFNVAMKTTNDLLARKLGSRFIEHPLLGHDDFVDFLHMNTAGQEKRADAIAEAIAS